MQAVELTLDPPGDDRVRAEWGALQQAGLPSLADHTGASNRPHVTLHVRDVVTPDAEHALVPVAARLPLGLRAGGLLLFHARRRWVVARQVVVDRALLDLHAALADAVGGGGSELTLPGRWVPHLTLARGVREEQLPAVLALLAETPAYDVSAQRLRRWDQEARSAWDVAQAPPERSL